MHFLVDSRIAVSVFCCNNLPTSLTRCNEAGVIITVGVNGLPLDEVEQVFILVSLSEYQVIHTFLAVNGMMIEELLGAVFLGEACIGLP